MPRAPRARAVPHVELWGTGANQPEKKAGGGLAGCVEVENKGLGFPGLTLPHTAV